MRSAVAACAVIVLAGCAGVRNEAPQRLVGRVTRIDIAHLPATYSEAQREKLLALYTALGPAAPDLLGRQGHPVYRVPAGGVELVISSREEFSVGDCVEVRTPAAAAGRRYFSLGEAEITRATGC